MKQLIHVFSLVLLSSVFTIAQDAILVSNESTTAETCTLTIELTNLKSDQGQIMIGLYDTENSWLNTSYKSERISIKNGTAIVVFKDVPYGTYAASAVHDEDKDGKMKTRMFGIPAEPYASSRGAIGMFGPPKWEDAKFILSNNTATEVIKF